MTAEALSPCPFCGGAAEPRAACGACWAECGHCHATLAGRDRAEVAARWNRRAPGAQSAGESPRPAAATAPADGTAERIRRMYPAGMPAQAAARVLGVCRNTFFARVRDGGIAYADAPGRRRLYSTEAVLRAAGGIAHEG